MTGLDPIFKDPGPSKADAAFEAALGDVSNHIRMLESDPAVCYAACAADPIQNVNGYVHEAVPMLVGRIGADANNGHKSETIDLRQYLKRIPLRDNQQRFAHLAGLRIVGDGQFDTVAATMTAVYSGYNQLGVFQNWQIKDSAGHVYVGGNVDARVLRDAMRARRGVDIEALPTDLADADATDTTNALNLTVIWGKQDPGQRKFMRDGLIPLHLIMAANAECQFDIAGSLPGSPAGVTWDGFVSGFKVIAYVVYLDEPVDGPKFRIESFTTPELSGTIPHSDWFTELLAIRHTPQDTGAQDNSDYDDFTINVAGFTTKSALGSDELAEVNRTHFQLDPDFTDFADLDLTGTAPTFSFLVEPAADLKGAVQGVIGFEFGARSTHVATRFLVIWWEPRKAEAEAQLRQLTGQYGPAQPARNNPARKLSPRLASAVPHILTK